MGHHNWILLVGVGEMCYDSLMIVAADTAALLEKIDTMPRPLCLVPTMGALHEGHLALIHEARRQVGPSGTVAVSIFVNPIQ